MIDKLAMWLFRPEHRSSMIATRVIVAGTALWIVLSRPDLPSVVDWPSEFWGPLNRLVLLRFGYFGFGSATEWFLYVALILLLVAVMFGVGTRVTALLAGILLYHFAPLEELLIYADLTGLSGLTAPTFGLLILSAANPPAQEETSPEYRWPVVLIQFIFAISILLAGVSKLTNSGPAWYTSSSIQAFAAAMWSFAQRPFAFRIATSAILPALIAAGSAILDYAFIFMVFSRRVRYFVIPLALAGLGVRSAAFGCHWLAAPLLLLFIDWKWISRVRPA
jgi:hypothetical protein